MSGPGGQTVSTDALVIDPEIQPRVAGIATDHVRALEEDPSAWDPIDVVRRGDGHLQLVNGFHRVAAAQNLGLESLRVTVTEPPQDGDLHGFAFQLNVRNGLPLTLADRRAESARLLKAHAEWSDREVGRRCGLSQPTIARIRLALESGEEIERAERRLGADAKFYPAPERKAGGLPAPSLGETMGALGARVFSGAERARQRKVTGYLRRLLVALDDQGDLLADATAAAEAVRLVLGDEDAMSLGLDLHPLARKVGVVAVLLAEPDGGEDR